MRSQIKLGRIFGIELGLHYSWFFIALLIVFSLFQQFHAEHQDWGNAIILTLSIATGLFFFVSLLLHELSHSLFAKSRGLRVREITLFALGGVSQIEKSPSSAKTELWIAFVGPLSSTCIGLICLGLRTVADPVSGPAYVMLSWLGYINLALAGFNMVPGYPRDGGHVLRAATWWKTGDSARSTRMAARVGQADCAVLRRCRLWMLFPMLKEWSTPMIGTWSVVLLFAASPQSSPTDVQAVIQRSVVANRLDWSAAPQYSYSERDRQDNGNKTYEVVMILGSPYRRLVGLNNEPLSPADQNKEGQLMKDAIAKRRAESREERVARTAEYEKERNRDRSLMDQLVEAFDFRSLGQQKLGDRDVYVLSATPRLGYHPPNIETEVLTGMRGTLWIDKNSFQWVKVAADVVHSVFIAGFFARVEPGTRFELDKAPVADGVWLPKHFAMKSRAKILFVITHRSTADETYFDYHQTDSSLTDIP